MWEATILFHSVHGPRPSARAALALSLVLLATATACTVQVPGWGGAALAANMIYTVGANQKVLALNPAARIEGKTFPAEGEWQYPPENDRRAGTSFAPPVVVGGTVYVTVHHAGGNPGSPGALIALDAGNGAQKWHFTVPSLSGQVVGPPVVADTTVYVGASDHYVYALDTNTGAERWRFRTGNKVWAGVAPDGAGVVYIASLDHNLYAVDAATGAERWRFETGGAIASTPLFANGRIYLGSADGNLYALDPRERSRGATFPAATEWRLSSDSWFWATPLHDGGRLYVGAINGEVYALDATTGRVIWKTRVGSLDAVVAGTPALAGGVLAVPVRDGKDGHDGRVYGLDAQTGQERWRYSTDPRGPVNSRLTSDGSLVYAYSLNQRLIALNAATGSPLWVCRTDQTGDKLCKG